MREEFYKWHSNDLDREFSMLVFGHYGYPVILFPTFKGRYWDAKDSGLINAAWELIESGKIKIYCPDGIDSLSWDNSSISPAEKLKLQTAYEHTIINDVIGYVKHETSMDRIGMAGCNFGAYHALNLSFKHPDMVEKLICIGGTFNIKPFINNFYNDDCYFNNPPDYLPNLEDNWYLSRFRNMRIILGTGENDPYSDQTLYISSLLRSKNVNHWLDVQPNTGHSWDFWKEAFPRYVSQIL